MKEDFQTAPFTVQEMCLNRSVRQAGLSPVTAAEQVDIAQLPSLPEPLQFVDTDSIADNIDEYTVAPEIEAMFLEAISLPSFQMGHYDLVLNLDAYSEEAPPALAPYQIPLGRLTVKYTIYEGLSQTFHCYYDIKEDIICIKPGSGSYDFTKSLGDVFYSELLARLNRPIAVFRVLFGKDGLDVVLLNNYDENAVEHTFSCVAVSPEDIPEPLPQFSPKLESGAVLLGVLKDTYLDDANTLKMNVLGCYYDYRSQKFVWDELPIGLPSLPILRRVVIPKLDGLIDLQVDEIVATAKNFVALDQLIDTVDVTVSLGLDEKSVGVGASNRYDYEDGEV